MSASLLATVVEQRDSGNGEESASQSRARRLRSFFVVRPCRPTNIVTAIGEIFFGTATISLVVEVDELREFAKTKAKKFQEVVASSARVEV